MDKEKHKMRIGWFWSVVGGICAVTIAFAISGRFSDIHDEFMKCYELKRTYCR